jgi:RND family efflux transporter MFP subunit
MAMASSLRDDLASLSIDRGRKPSGKESRAHDPRGVRGDGGIGILSVLIWLIPLGLLAGAGVFAYRQYDQIRAKPQVTVGLVQEMTTGEAETLLSAKGYLKSRHQALIGAKVPGRVEKILVEEGSRVKKGDVLAVLEHRDLDALLASRKAMLLRNEADLAEARVDLKQKEREANRADRLHAQRMLSLEESEKAQSAFAMCGAHVAALEAAVELTRANIQEAEENIRIMSIYAPFDGTVVEKQGEEGEVITPSAMSASISRSAVVSLANLGLMDVEADIAEKWLSRVALNQPAEVSVSAVPSRRYRGRLRQIIPMGDRTRETIKVKVEILDPDDRLFPEMAATVYFLPDKALHNPDANRAFLFVPKAAIFEQNGHEYAWVVDTRSAQSTVRKRVVQVAATNADLTRVESGLKSGESVVLNPPKTLREGTVVKAAD